MFDEGTFMLAFEAVPISSRSFGFFYDWIPVGFYFILEVNLPLKWLIEA